MRGWLISLILLMGACEGDTYVEVFPGGGDTSGGTDTTAAGDTSTLGDTATATDPDTAVDPDATTVTEGCLDFASQIQPIFDTSCVGCHNGPNAQSGLDLSSGAALGSLVDVAAQGNPQATLVVPGDPDASWLVTKLEPNPPVGQQMPFGGSPQPGEVALIRDWIDQGALAQPAEGCGDPPAAGSVVITQTGPIELGVAELTTLTAQLLDEDGDPKPAAVSWSTSDSHHVYVDKTGQLLGITPGSATITAHAAGESSEPLTVTVVDATVPDAKFVSDARLVLQDSCALAGCHVDGVEEGDLRLDRPPQQMYEKLVEEEAEAVDDYLIQPNSALGSYLFRKIIDPTPAAGAQMPYGSAPLDAAKVRTILQWILTGAAY